MDIGAMVHLLIIIIVLGLVFFVCYWALGQAGLPEPWNKVAIVVLALVALLVILNYVLLPLLGSSGAVKLH